MKLNDVLKIIGGNGLISIKGLIDELPVHELQDLMNADFYKKYKDKNILLISLISTNDKPELYIILE